MTFAAVWKVADRIYAVADTRISNPGVGSAAETGETEGCAASLNML
jgi:hypothetical protein